MKKSILTIMAIGLAIVTNAQWTNSGDNTTTGKVTLKEVKFPLVNFDFSKMPRTQIDPMSIKLFDDYYTFRPGGSSPDNNAYGTLLAINGRTSHWENNIYFGAVTNKMYFRISKYAQHTAENGVKGDYNEWRTLLDNMSDVKSSKLLKMEGNGVHYFSSGNLSVGTTTSKGRLHVNGSIYSQIGEGFKLLGDSNYFGQYKDGIVFQMEDANGTNGNTDGGFVFRGHTPTDGLSKEWMVIKTGGRVGIGTSSPSQILDIESGNNDGSNPPVLRLTSKDINAVNDQLLGEIQFYSKDADGPHVSAYIKNLAAETYGRQGQLSFGTTAGNSSNAIERMRINDTGIVGIGTNPGEGNSPMSDLKLHVNGSITVNSGKKIALDQNHYSHGYMQYNSSVSKARFLRYGYYGHRFDDNGGTRMVIEQGGNVGIGTTSPSAKLHVAGTFISAGNMSNTFGSGSTLTLFGGSTKGNRLIAGADDDGAYIRSTWASGGTDAISFRNSSGAKTMIIDANNNVGIGVTDTKGYNLAVAGSNGIVAEKVTVKLQATWPDYVFTNDYKLPTLEEVEQQISKNGHLANIPSAEEVKKNGVELGEMNKKLLEK